MDSQTEEQQQFEQVLHRLDALIKRGQGQPPVETAELQQDADAAGDDLEASLEAAQAPDDAVSPQADAIPVLTEIYEESGDGIPLLLEEIPSDDTQAETLAARLLPELTETLERLVEEESRRFRAALQERLQDEVAALLKQRLEEGGRDQTEI